MAGGHLPQNWPFVSDFRERSRVRRLEQLKIRKLTEIGAIVSAEFRHAVGQHGRDDLQVEHMRTSHRASLQQGKQAPRNIPGNRENKNMYVREENLNEIHRIARRIGIGYALWARNSGIEFGDDLRRDVEGAGACNLQQHPACFMAWVTLNGGINENVGVNEERVAIARHRCQRGATIR